MRMIDAVTGWNRKTEAMNKLGPELYKALLPWQGKKIIKADGKEFFLESHEHEYQVLKAMKILSDHDIANGRAADRFYWRYEPS